MTLVREDKYVTDETDHRVAEPPDGRNVMHIAHHYPASSEAVDQVINAPIGHTGGRSEWRWIRLANGDLILGVYPQGETYFAVEEAVSADYTAAETANAVAQITLDDADLRDQGVVQRAAN